MPKNQSFSNLSMMNTLHDNLKLNPVITPFNLSKSSFSNDLEKDKPLNDLLRSASRFFVDYKNDHHINDIAGINSKPFLDNYHNLSHPPKLQDTNKELEEIIENKVKI